MRIKLNIREENQSCTHTIEIEKDRLTIGRKDVDIALGDPLCSHQHAMLCESPCGTLKIEDLRSKNGTYVGGKKISGQVLFTGDIVRIGTTRLVIVEFQSSSHESGATHTTGDDRICNQWPDNMTCLPKRVQNQFADYVDLAAVPSRNLTGGSPTEGRRRLPPTSVRFRR